MSNIPPDDLDGQIQEARRSIVSDGYPMSIGELTNIYRDRELLIRPEFQRFFRWNATQKSRLIESLLLAIPLPSIFVSQTEMGKWELVDGLQRVSTILQLQGELRDANDKVVEPLILQGTKYLPGLEGRRWQHPNLQESLTEAQRLDIKRSKIDIKIIKRESSKATKYDLFQRLNSYGSSLTSQELRSALLVAVSSEFFTKLEALASHPSYVRSLSLSDRLLEERFDLELLIRFLILHNKPAAQITLRYLRDFSNVLDNEAVEIAEAYPKDFEQFEITFKKTFDVIEQNGGEQLFRRWDSKKNDFKGPFLSTAFEVFALGVGYHVANNTPFKQNLLDVVKEFWNRPNMQGGYATGRSTEERLVQFIPVGRNIIAI